ncbi:hypothetical protein ACMU_03435 [Actibacterium mucosum KCTC 23349]|uniref:Swiss Army Knife protein DSP-PTPase phosphatase domain-containing protein n=2 Tax=Actibacterium TaxID=1433986 RepID=A0A037ZCB7_9RHOB|nr:hypothetical protein ACMU_03435 [Actibacterium mucosum KCTC 23349]
MLRNLWSRLKGFETHLRQNWGRDISTPSGRRNAWWHFQLMDHAFLRVLWTNLDEIAPGVWRSNQPSPKRIKRYARMGIRNIIYLRGEAPKSHLLFERETCAQLDIGLHNVSLSARNLCPADEYLKLLDLFDRLEKPFLMHCKSGADRAGLASAMYLIHAEGKSVAEARAQLSFKYLHLKNDSTGVLDFMLEKLEVDQKNAPQTLRTWLQSTYDQTALSHEFAQKRAARSG